MKDWVVTDADRELFDRELDGFVPPKIFDAHAHWYRADHFAADVMPALVQSGPAFENVLSTTRSGIDS
jgi:hypothetical protein